MSDTNIPAGLKYTKDHEWAKVDGSRVTVGITAFAVESLGDITLIDLGVEVGETVEAGKAFGTVDSVKTVSDLFAPLGGKIVEINLQLETNPELVNEDCYGKGWIVVLEASDPSAVAGLLDAQAYAKHVKDSAH